METLKRCKKWVSNLLWDSMGPTGVGFVCMVLVLVASLLGVPLWLMSSKRDFNWSEAKYIECSEKRWENVQVYSQGHSEYLVRDQNRDIWDINTANNCFIYYK